MIVYFKEPNFGTGRGSRSTALDPVANTDTKLLILWAVSKGRVLAQDGVSDHAGAEQLLR